MVLTDARVKMQLLDKQSHKERGYNNGTLLAGRLPADFLRLVPYDQMWSMVLIAIFSLVSTSPSKVSSKSSNDRYATSARVIYALLLSQQQVRYFQHDKR